MATEMVAVAGIAGYDPTAILASRIAEGATVMLLGSFLPAESARRARSRR